MSDLDEKFLLAMDGLGERTAAWLQRQGVPEITLQMWPGPVGVAAIETRPLGLFDFAEHGRRAFIQPVLSGPAFSDILDLIAWYPDNPGRCWTRLYTGVPLGVDQLDHAEIEGEPLLLHASPLDWLRARGEGVCVLDWKISAPALRCVPVLLFEQTEFGRLAHDRLSAPSPAVPEIRIIQNQKAA